MDIQMDNENGLDPIFYKHTTSDLCMLGSHDSGMSRITHKTGFTPDGHVITQTRTIRDQIELGVRYFDIRPVYDDIYENAFYTGHFSEVSGIGAFGGTGQSIEEIINDINVMTSKRKDLILFLNLSHASCWYKNSIGVTYLKPLTQNNWNDLLGKLGAITNLYCIKEKDIDLTKIKLGDYLGWENPTSKVILIVEDPSVDISGFQEYGVFKYKSFDAYNRYSDTDDLGRMTSDQIDKMKRFYDSGRNLEGHNTFLLSWTLTLPTVSTSTVLELAEKANAALYPKLWPIIAKSLYPNILYVDGIKNMDQLSLCNRINIYLITGRRE